MTEVLQACALASVIGLVAGLVARKLGFVWGSDDDLSRPERGDE